MRHLMFCIALLSIPVFAQDEFGPPVSKDDPLQIKTLKPLPTGVILIPGAVPSASDTRTPLPEGGDIRKNVYQNAYFGMTYAFPEDWREEFKGPPPSDNGAYVLANLTTSRASILITAQDEFFAIRKVNVPAYYKIDSEPAEVKIANATFSTYSYSAPVAGLHWYVFSTSIRCHAVQFVFTSQDTALLDSLVENLKQIALHGDDVPRCVPNYAPVSRVEPVLPDNKFNPIPARIIIGKNGKVRHVHVLSAFPAQAQAITDALLQWRFKPADEEIETGVLFGSSQMQRRDAAVTAAAND
jgi:hypothetical protein